jgi:hypothetical protein
MAAHTGEPDWRAAAAGLGFGPLALRGAPALRHAAHLLAVSGRPREAEGAYRELLRGAPEDRAALLGLAALLQAGGRRAEADDCRRRLVELDVKRFALPPQEHARALAFRLAAAGLAPPPERAPAEYVARAFDGYAASYEGHMQGALGYHGPDVLFAAVSRVVGPGGRAWTCWTSAAAPAWRRRCSARWPGGSTASTSRRACSRRPAGGSSTTGWRSPTSPRRCAAGRAGTTWSWRWRC